MKAKKTNGMWYTHDGKKLYGTRWQKERKVFLMNNPWCVMCKQDTRRMVKANVVDHVRPHKGDMILFWDKANWQSLCRTHHNSVKAREEAGTKTPSIKLDGSPEGQQW